MTKMTRLVCIEQLIQNPLKDFCWEKFEHPLYWLDLVLIDYYLTPQFKE